MLDIHSHKVKLLQTHNSIIRVLKRRLNMYINKLDYRWDNEEETTNESIFGAVLH